MRLFVCLQVEADVCCAFDRAANSQYSISKSEKSVREQIHMKRKEHRLHFTFPIHKQHTITLGLRNKKEETAEIQMQFTYLSRRKVHLKATPVLRPAFA